MEMRYCIQIYTGSGKGKSSAALGAALRMAGSGGSVVLARFLKPAKSSELDALAFLPSITVCPVTQFFGFTFRMTEEEKRRAYVYYTKLFDEAICTAKERHAQMLVLDELNCACHAGVIDCAHVYQSLQTLKGRMEIVITGRNAPEELIALADYVTELKKIRHPFDEGLAARKGIEF